MVTDVEPANGNDVLVVEQRGELSRYPMVRAFVAGVDISAGTVTLTPWDDAN